MCNSQAGWGRLDLPKRNRTKCNKRGNSSWIHISMAQNRHVEHHKCRNCKEEEEHPVSVRSTQHSLAILDRL